MSPDAQDPRTAPEPVTAPEPATLPADHDRQRMSLLARLLAPLLVLVGVIVKFGAFTIKFFGIFISVGALRPDLGLAVRRGLRAADPRARARPLPRGEAAGSRRGAARVHPVRRRLRAAAKRAVRSLAERRSSRSRARSQAGRGGRAARRRRGAGRPVAARARVHRLLPQPRSTSSPSGSSTAARSTAPGACCVAAPVGRAAEDAKRLGWIVAVLTIGTALLLVARDDRRARPAGPSVTEGQDLDRRLLRRRPRAAGGRRVADRRRVPGRLPGGRPDRPARGLRLRLGAGRRGDRRGTRPHARSAPSCSRGRASPSSPAAARA